MREKAFRWERLELSTSLLRAYSAAVEHGRAGGRGLDRACGGLAGLNLGALTGSDRAEWIITAREERMPQRSTTNEKVCAFNKLARRGSRSQDFPDGTAGGLAAHGQGLELSNFP